MCDEERRRWKERICAVGFDNAVIELARRTKKGRWRAETVLLSLSPPSVSKTSKDNLELPNGYTVLKKKPGGLIVETPEGITFLPELGHVSG